jgi:hypothetical protein
MSEGPPIDGLAAVTGSSAANGPLPRRQRTDLKGNRLRTMAFASSVRLRASKVTIGSCLLTPGAAHFTLTPLRRECRNKGKRTVVV